MPLAVPSPPKASAIFSPSKKTPIKKLCIIGECSDSEVLRLLEAHYGVEIAYSDSGTEYSNCLDEVVFMVSDFECKAMASIKEMNGIRIISPAYVRSRYARHLELTTPRPGRPAYCELLRSATMVFENQPKRSRLVEMAHYLNASVRKEANDRVTHLITSTVRCKNYRTVWSLGRHILRPEYILRIWENRGNFCFDVNDRDLISEYRLRPLEGLRIFFVGFEGAELADMEKTAKQNNGEVVLCPETATHFVCNTKSMADLPCLESRKDQCHVSAEWLWQSVTLEGCACEDSYPAHSIGLHIKKTSRGVFSPVTTAISRQSRSSSALLDTSNSSLLNEAMYSTDDLEKLSASPRRVDKRHQVCTEMHETELNYLKALHLLLKFKEALEEANAKGNEQLLNASEIALIFNKVKPIVEVHEKICKEIGELVNNWRPENQIGKVWVTHSSELLKAYSPYTNSYETMKSTLEEADARNARFHAFLKAHECNPEYKRNTVIELLIRPVQRLPSVLLLLKEIDKRTDSKSKDKESLSAAAKAISGVLEKANYNRAMNDDYTKLFNFCMDIENIPAHLISANRELVKELSVQCLGGSEGYKANAKKTIRMLLFNDTLELAKDRVAEVQRQGSGTISRMSRQFSLSNIRNGTLNGDRKRPRFKHIGEIPLIFIRAIYWVDCGEDANAIVFTVRGEREDEEFVVMPQEEHSPHNVVIDFLHELSKQIWTQFGRETDANTMRLENMSAVVKNCINKHLNKRGQLNSTFSLNQSSFLPPSSSQSSFNVTQTTGKMGFRRALSNASLTISSKLRLQSRVNLKQIYENDSPFLSDVAESPAGRGGDSPSSGDVTQTPFTPTSGRSMTLRSLLNPFSSRSSIKRRESGKENENDPTFRFSSQV